MKGALYSYSKQFSTLQTNSQMVEITLTKIYFGLEKRNDCHLIAYY